MSRLEVRPPCAQRRRPQQQSQSSSCSAQTRSSLKTLHTWQLRTWTGLKALPIHTLVHRGLFDEKSKLKAFQSALFLASNNSSYQTGQPHVVNRARSRIDMHVLITGCSGMIGRKLTARLCKNKGPLDNKPIDRLTLLDEVAAELPAGFLGEQI